ncbi:MAG: hypothetical protein ACRD2G_03540 [Terriglobia bacterium]
MSNIFDRRTFIGICSALAAWVAGQSDARSESAPQARSGEVKHRNPVVAIQVPPYVWIDEGVDRALDNMQGKGDVNTVWAYTNTYSNRRIRKGDPIPLPDHGVYGESSPPYVGGAFFDYDKKYFRGTILKDFRSPDYGNFNVITQVAPKLKARSMDFIAWDYNNAFTLMAQNVPGFPEVAEVDVYGRRTNNPCFNSPDYRNYLLGKIECYLKMYPGEVDGIAWGCERMGPLQNAIGGPFSWRGISCFCRYCRAKARSRDISVDRARQGYQKLDQFISAALKDERPTDGYFVTFWRLLCQYPEISAWERLWTDSYHEARSGVYGTAKSISPEKPFGFHIMQEVTFSPFYRAEEDYAVIRNYTDFLKLATYNNAGGPRMASYLDRLSATIFHDAAPQDFTEFYYKIMNIQEVPYDKLRIAGLSADYVARETRRAIADTGGKIRIYPSVDIDVPTGPNQKKTSPDDVRQAVRAAFGAGANGVVLARDYNEMWLDHLAAAGETLREIFHHSAG